MTEGLELRQLAQHHCVSQVDVRGGRVDAELDPQGAALRSRPHQLVQQLFSRQRIHAAKQQLLVFFARLDGNVR